MELRVLPYRGSQVKRLPDEAKAALNGRDGVAEITGVDVLERRRISVALADQAR